MWWFFMVTLHFGLMQKCIFAKQSKAKQSKAKQSKAKQSKAKQSKAIALKCSSFAKCTLVFLALPKWPPSIALFFAVQKT